jgi:hypothetical protein
MAEGRQVTRRRTTAKSPAPAAATRSPVLTSAEPAELELPADAGSRQRTVLSLQRAAGNRAVAASLADITRQGGAPGALRVVNPVASTMAPPPDGVERIHAIPDALTAAGVTTLPAPGAPDVVVSAPTQAGAGGWQAAVQSTQSTPDTPTSLYPGTGVHDMTAGPVGQARHRDVTGPASDEIRRGEEEHLLDLEWARDLAYDRTADAINRVAASAPATGATAEQARAAAVDAVRSALPGQLRWQPGVDPGLHFRRVYGALVGATRSRDSQGWHNMTSGIVADPAENRRLHLPPGDELWRYVAGSTQVGSHPTPALLQATYNGLPAGPASSGQPAGQAPTAPAGPTGAASPAGDYEYKPSDRAYAVKALPSERVAKG